MTEVDALALPSNINNRVTQQVQFATCNGTPDKQRKETVV
jgi:hypothetical protein